MIVELKTITLKQQKFAEYIRARGPFRWQVDLGDFACFIYWLSGHNKLYTINRQVVSSGRDSLLLKCGAYIDDVLADPEEETEALIIHLYPELLRQLFRDEIPSALKYPPRQTLPIRMGPHVLLEKFADNIMLYFSHPEIADEDLLQLKTRELILLLSKTQQWQTLAQLFSYLFTPQELSFHEIIGVHLYSSLSLKELAYLAHRSMASFKRDFQRYYHTSPARYIKHKKLERAARLLTFTRMRITDIMFECGFSNLSHFTRLFHQKYHLSPSLYRMSHMENTLS